MFALLLIYLTQNNTWIGTTGATLLHLTRKPQNGRKQFFVFLDMPKLTVCPFSTLTSTGPHANLSSFLQDRLLLLTTMILPAWSPVHKSTDVRILYHCVSLVNQVVEFTSTASLVCPCFPFAAAPPGPGVHHPHQGLPGQLHAALPTLIHPRQLLPLGLFLKPLTLIIKFPCEGAL